MRLTHWMRLAGAVGLALAFPLAIPASAEVSGPCKGTIKNVDVATRSSAIKSQAILVKKTENLVVGATTAAGRLDRYKIQLAFFGRNWTVAKGSADGSSWSKTVNVSTYARYGVGYYKVSGVSSGGVNCTGAVLVKVEGSPFGSIAGLVGAGLSVIGIGAVATNTLRGFGGGPKPAPLLEAHTNPVTAFIDIKTPRDYVNRVQAICGKPGYYEQMVTELCTKPVRYNPQICLWG